MANSIAEAFAFVGKHVGGPGDVVEDLLVFEGFVVFGFLHFYQYGFAHLLLFLARALLPHHFPSV